MSKKQHTILICEDEKESVKAVTHVLERRGYRVYTASDGETAIQQAKDIQPDIILADIRMPKIDGIEAVKTIRTFNADVKIIIITAFQSPQLMQEASAYNISDYIIKPLSGEKLLEVIEAALK